MRYRQLFVCLVLVVLAGDVATAQKNRSADESRPGRRRAVTDNRKIRNAGESGENRSLPIRIDNHPAIDILRKLGATLETEISITELNGYLNSFDRTDPNRDGFHSKEEYIEQGRYMTPQARAGIFRAADGNSDGVVSRSEYVLNRIITDEGKSIIQRMDDNQNGLVEREEFTKHVTQMLSDAKLAEKLFWALDVNHDGGIPIPEYLRVWGQWARADQQPAEKRIERLQAELAKSSGKTGSESSSPRVTPPSRNPGFGRPAGGPPPGRPAPGNGPPSVDVVFQRFDRNQDGKLQKDEIPAAVQQFILPADTNGDDVVTKEELQASRQRQRLGGRPAGSGENNEK
jgi:Ca2+-binding EF-hand superfamily protein